MNDPQMTGALDLAVAIVDFASCDESAAFAFCRQMFGEEGWPLEVMDPAIAAGFDRPRDVVLLAKWDSAIQGCAALKERSVDEALLTRMFVGTSQRGTGLAQTLFDTLFARARQLGYLCVMLDVNRESARAIRFYEKQGMERFIPDPHPRWLDSAPDELQYAFHVCKRV